MTFEYTSPSTLSQPNSLLFIGGLGDGLATTSYTADLVKSLEATNWSFFTLQLTSSYCQWGLGHLDRDTEEIAKCVQYIQQYKTTKYGGAPKVVIMGHSTGSQCVLHYLYRPNPHTNKSPFDPYLVHRQRPPVDGAIMHAPVSDREAIMSVLREGLWGRSAEEIKAAWDQAEAFAKAEMAKSGHAEQDTIIPLWMTVSMYGNVPISCRRFMSLASPSSPDLPGDDDLFSSDLSDEQLRRTFGRVRDRGLLRSKLAVIMCGRDASVPAYVDKEKLLARWKAATEDGPRNREIWDDAHSGIIPNASHALSDPDQTGPREWLCKRVLSYLESVGMILRSPVDI